MARGQDRNNRYIRQIIRLFQLYNLIQYTPIMILRQTTQILRSFGRLVKPKLSSHDNIFQLMKDKTVELNFINNFNNSLLHTTKDLTFAHMLNTNLNIPQGKCDQVSTTVLHSTAYSPIWMKPYRLSQKLSGDIKIEDNPNSVQIPYNPEQSHLKYHYSIDKPIRVMKELKLQNKQTVFIFNLPENITENKISMSLGYRQVKNARIQRCMLGLPAYAVVQFSHQSYIKQKYINKESQIVISERVCKVVTHANSSKLQLNRRQLVLRGVNQNQTPSEMVIKLSKFGKVMDLNLPMEIYRQPSMKEIKQLYKNEKNPVCINYHRKNGTIESEYYPAFNDSKKEQTLLQNKEEEYKRRLRYCQNIDVYEGEEGKIKTKTKGFCIVTYSCQQQAQNCYLHLGKFMKMELLNGKEQFQFDENHRLALLRQIDNGYLEKCMEKGPYSDKIQEDKKNQKEIFQSLFARNTLSEKAYERIDKELESIRSQYVSYINEFKNSIGIDNLKENPVGNNQYGKSFDELAEQQLYGVKLNQNRSQRYKVQIDEYMKEREQIVTEKKQRQIQFEDQQTSEVRRFQEETKNDKENLNLNKQIYEPDAKIIIQQKDQEARRSRHQDNEGNKRFAKQKVKKRLNKSSGNQQGSVAKPPQKGKAKFSSFKIVESEYRPKTLEQKIRSHINYNRFVRDTINQYMGVFPIQKLQTQFYRKKPTFTNPQSLKCSDGTQFIEQEQVRGVLQFSVTTQQQFYNSFVKQNEIIKSLNLDVQELVLKNLEENQGRILQYYSDFGIVKKQYTYKGEDIESEVRKLNNEAEFGQQYRAIEGEDGKKDKIVGVSKIESILPLSLIKKCEQAEKILVENQEYSQEKHEIIKKHMDYLTNGLPIPDELAYAFGLQKNTILDFDSVSEFLNNQLEITKKDFEKILNIDNYSEQQISSDISRQMKISKIREKMASKQASDYSRDPSSIKVKSKNQRAVVSKFRQI